MASSMKPLLLLACILLVGHCQSLQGNHATEMACTEPITRCRAKRDCRTALRSIDETCKTFDGRCSAEMVDLLRCGKIMDLIFSHGFPDEGCKCTKNLQRCSALHEKIYVNPCFVSIRHLRMHGLFPDEVKTSAEANVIDSPTTSVPEYRESENFNPKHDTDKKAFVDNSIATTVFASFDKDKDLPENTFNLVDDEHDTKTDKVGETNEMGHNDVPKGPETPEHGEMEDSGGILPRENGIDYKLITIILGTILGIFVLTAVVFFAWSRVRHSLLYTKGKVISKRSKEDGPPSSRSENGTTPRSKA